MATLALSVAGQFVGGALGGPLGATIGRALGALAGSVVDNQLFGSKPRTVAAAGSDIRLQGSAEGGPIPRLYGWNRFTGNIIWATELEEVTHEASGAKGVGQSEDTKTTTILANFAVGLCEGEVHRLGRIWADGELLETEELNFRFYRGTETQGPDSLIEAKQGAGNAPAYRGLCYLVFEQLDLTPFGNRIPNLAVELCRVVGELEPAITAVTVIPGATEFGYDPQPRVRVLGRGATANENAHVYPNVSDWTLSIDELTALCPNLRQVSLVVAWFGDDLRCGQCTVSPRVESASREVKGAEWRVSGARARRRAGGLGVRGAVGLWRHALGCGRAGGDRRPQGARAGGDALSDDPDGHRGGEQPAEPLHGPRGAAGISVARTDHCRPGAWPAGNARQDGGRGGAGRPILRQRGAGGLLALGRTRQLQRPS